MPKKLPSEELDSSQICLNNVIRELEATKKGSKNGGKMPCGAISGIVKAKRFIFPWISPVNQVKNENEVLNLEVKSTTMTYKDQSAIWKRNNCLDIAVLWKTTLLSLQSFWLEC